MQVIRREFLSFSVAALAIPSASKIAFAQAAQATPKLAQILRKDLENQGLVVQETVVSLVEFAPGSAAPWHMHPGAQEQLQRLKASGRHSLVSASKYPTPRTVWISAVASAS